jgi:aryl-alcohol dehydrogenase-like predicted oxidoreductase
VSGPHQRGAEHRADATGAEHADIEPSGPVAGPLERCHAIRGYCQHGAKAPPMNVYCATPIAGDPEQAEDKRMRTRRLGRTGHQSSVIIYGAAMLSKVSQDTADRSIQQALDGGINHFDVAASYGDAELRLGPWMPRIRSQIFLATKTGEREADAAWRQINDSLRRLQTNHLDLIQLHGVNDLDELDKATGPGGALESAVRARDEGLTRYIGITGHGHAAPSTHLEALRRFDFDTVLTPLNYALGSRGDYYRDFLALTEQTQARDVGLMTIKSGARRTWPDDARPNTTWYQPLDTTERVTASVAWVLSHEAITGIPSAGDVQLLDRFLAAERDSAAMSRADAAAVLEEIPDYASPFLLAS